MERDASIVKRVSRSLLIGALVSFFVFLFGPFESEIPAFEGNTRKLQESGGEYSGESISAAPN
jgi:hypothetical protein